MQRQLRWMMTALLGLALASGCEGEQRVLAPGQARNDPAQGAATAAPEQVQTRETIRKTTQNVLKLDEALAQGGQRAATTIPEEDYLSQQASAYRTTVGRIGSMNVEHQLQIYKAANIMEGDKPITYDVFLSDILKKDKPDGIQLPMLPYYQEYAWDEANEKLVVVEFPAKKAQYEQQQDERFGRN